MSDDIKIFWAIYVFMFSCMSNIHAGRVSKAPYSETMVLGGIKSEYR